MSSRSLYSSSTTITVCATLHLHLQYRPPNWCLGRDHRHFHSISMLPRLAPHAPPVYWACPAQTDRRAEVSVYHCPLCPLIFQYRTEVEWHLREEHRSGSDEEADLRAE